MLDPKRREDLRNQTIGLILEVRTAYLKTPGCNQLDHWNQLLTRCRRAATQALSVEEWFSILSRGLRLPAASSSLSFELQTLTALVDADTADWLRMLEDETPALMARCRNRADAARAVREQGKEEDSNPNDTDEMREAADAAASEKPVAKTRNPRKAARP